jgi:peptide/nickel transport system substrate-binding protein
MKRLVLTVALAVLPGVAASAQEAGDAIRPIVLLTQPQAAAPQEYQAAAIIADAWRKLGLTVNLRPLPGQEFNQVIWYERQRWDATTWQMVGRPERSDPDELTYNLFVSANAANGYDFVGYKNPEYDKLAQEQRTELDLDKRKALIMQAQELINHDQPYGFEVHPFNVVAYNKTVWDPKSMISQAGIGIRSTWTWLNITPLGTQKDVILNSVAPPTNLNPFNISGQQGSWAAEIVWDRLMRVDPEGLPEPWAAEKADRPDATTVNVTLRKGMKWSDGQPVTIEDAVFSLVAPGYGDKAPMYKPFVTNIASVEATGPDTLTIKLKHPDAAFLVSSLSKLNLAPKHIWQPIFDDLKNKPQTAESIQEEHPVSSGPFRIVKASLNQEIVLEANPDHWSHPKINRWIMRIMPNVEASLGALKSGEINFLADYTGDPEVLKDLAKSNPNIEVSQALDIGFKFIAYNERRPPFDNLAFRQAISAVIDRKLLAEDAWGGAAEPANSWISPALGVWHAKGIVDRVPGGNVAAAQKILKDAGFVLVGNVLHYPMGGKETTEPFH